MAMGRFCEHALSGDLRQPLLYVRPVKMAPLSTPSFRDFGYYFG
jgi:hypothetical protein